MDSELGSWVLGHLVRGGSGTTTRMRVGDALMKGIGGGRADRTRTKFHFMKAALLIMLREEYSAVSITEDMLLKLEVLEELHLRSLHPLSPALPAAYCAIAVECTLKYLDLEPSPSNNPAYLSAVDRIWRRLRLRKIEGGSVLFSDELKRWSSDIEASFQDPEVRERLRTMNSRRYAMQRLKLLLDEAQNDLGPPFLEFAASITTGPDTPTASTAHLHTAKLKEPEPPIENQIVDEPVENHCIDAPVENHSVNVPGENLYVDAPSEKESIDAPVESQCIENQSIDAQIEKQTTDAPMENESADAHMKNDGADNQVLHEQPVSQTTASHHTSLMDRNNTARTYEWDTLTDGFEEETPGCSVQLPSPNRRRKMPPLKFNEPPRIVKRRKAKKWSALEEETLRNAVNSIGEGNWKLILEFHKDVFVERTQVDLKDKWRNLSRYRGR